ncbi:hypothetical protein H5410_062449 [Solanum commersonii]|uniref:Uncharacterized protein n=1 Tax=Solanum commersonii TaxID=4109 RepID=A0A9J5WAE6_SOLCO|nr:hypothetical protein H5410_062449 [Solanum commersonii]
MLHKEKELRNKQRELTKNQKIVSSPNRGNMSKFWPGAIDSPYCSTRFKKGKELPKKQREYSPLLNSSSGVSNGQWEINSLEREEGIPFTGRDWRLGQYKIYSSEREEGSTDSESDWRLGQHSMVNLEREEGSADSESDWRLGQLLIFRRRREKERREAGLLPTVTEFERKATPNSHQQESLRHCDHMQYIKRWKEFLHMIWQRLQLPTAINTQIRHRRLMGSNCHRKYFKILTIPNIETFSCSRNQNPSKVLATLYPQTACCWEQLSQDDASLSNFPSATVAPQETDNLTGEVSPSYTMHKWNPATFESLSEKYPKI